MSRSKQDILDTESMLRRLRDVLYPASTTPEADRWGEVKADSESLRRISMTLHRWHELECGDSNDYGSWAIVRGNWAKTDSRRAPRQPDGTRWPREFIHDDDGAAFMERHEYRWQRDGTTGQQVNRVTTVYTAIPDREAGARKRLAQILKRYPTLTAYVQGDPRGCALYILKPGDVPEGSDVSSCYNRGLAVHQ